MSHRSRLEEVVARGRGLGRRAADRVVSWMEHGTPMFGPRSSPPGPVGDVILGDMRGGWDDPLELFLRAATEHGDIARLRFGRHFYVLINDPEMIHHVLVENSRNYKKSRYHLGMEMVMGKGLVTSDGDFWRRERRLAQPAFHRERIAGFVATMSASTRASVARLRGAAGRAVALDDELRRLTFDIVCRTLFDVEVRDDDDDEYGRAAMFLSDYVNGAFFVPAWIPTAANREFARGLALFDRLVWRVIAERRARGDGGRGGTDVLSMLMAARDDATGEGMSDRQLRDEMMTLLLAGFETTSNALAWTFYLLSTHPDVERRLREHALEVVGERDLTAADLPRLAYVTQVLHESMRLYPPAWIIERESLGEDRLGGYIIPAGTTVAACPWALHRRPDRWTHPEGFDPDRFAPARMQALPRCAYLPFGTGPRICIGNAFAATSSAVILTMMVRELRLELVPGHKVVPEPATSLRPKSGLRVVPRIVSDAP